MLSWLRRVLVLVLVLAMLATGVIIARGAWVMTRDPPADLAGVRAQLAFLRTALDGGAGERMQQRFPEGYFFCHVLHGLAWTQVAERDPAWVDQARREATRAAEALDSVQGRAPFSAELHPRYGIFHAGWSLLLRARTATLAPDAVMPGELRRVRADADALAAAVTDALDGGGSPFLEAYPGQAWPVDTVVAMAALRAADEATGTDHRRLVERWRTTALEHADPDLGLLPHQVDPDTGVAVEAPRGSSQSIIQHFWPALDPRGAAAVYRRFRTVFVTRELGLVGVREYPAGVEGRGDVDSGPLVRGLSASASAVTIAGARTAGDVGLGRTLAREAELVGQPVTWRGERRYLGGVLPVADAFLAWALSTPAAPEPLDPPLTAIPAAWGWWLAAAWFSVAAATAALAR
jgi:hypothetical protein